MDDFESKLRCEAKDLISPTNQIQFLEDEALIGGETPIQLRPQRVKLSLRRDTPLNLTFSFRLAENYPIDMYYLMDLSNSMGDDKVCSKISSISRWWSDSHYSSFLDKNFVSKLWPSLVISCQPKCEREQQTFVLDLGHLWTSS